MRKNENNNICLPRGLAITAVNMRTRLNTIYIILFEIISQYISI